MGMRFNMGNGRAVRCAAAVLAAVTMLMYIGVTNVYADGISASEMDQQIAEQEAAEQQQAAQQVYQQPQQQAAAPYINLLTLRISAYSTGLKASPINGFLCTSPK